jgi:hypothetical protein
MPSQGSYPLTIETRNLPPGVIFRTTIHRLDPQGNRTGIHQVDFPATVNVSPGICQARASIPVETGSQFLTAIAKTPLQTAYCPVLDGEPLDTLVAELDSKGKQSLRFRTASGREVSWDDALNAAKRQGKAGFPKSAI